MLKPTTDIFKSIFAQPVLTDAGEHPQLIEVSWVLLKNQGHAIQIYVDHEVREVVTETEQHSCWLALDRRRPHVIAVLGVDPTEAFVAQPERLKAFQPDYKSHASLSMLRDESLPHDAVAEVKLDGTIVHQRPLWEGHIHRSGFGNLFGMGDFGNDAITGPGLGRGSLGHGPLGSDAHRFVVNHELQAGSTQTLSWSLKAPSGENLTPFRTLSITSDLPVEPLTTLTLDETHLRW